MIFPIRSHALASMLLLVLVAIAQPASPADAAVPRTTSLQGILTDASGLPIADGTHSLHVRLYDDETAGTMVWNEIHSVDTEGGLFTVILGSITPLDIALDEPLWVSTEVDGNGEITPRIPLTAAPYALTSRTVEPDAIGETELADGTAVRSLNGLTDGVSIAGNGGITVSEVGNSIVIDGAGGTGGSDSDWLISGDEMYAIPQGNIGMGTSDPTADLHVYDANFATSLMIEDATPDVGFHTSSLSMRTPVGTGRLEFFSTGSGTTLNIFSPFGPTMDINLDGKELSMQAEDFMTVEVAGTERARFSSNLEMFSTGGEETIEIVPTTTGRMTLRATGNSGQLLLQSSNGQGAEIRGDNDDGELAFVLRGERDGQSKSGVLWLYEDGQQTTLSLGASYAGSAGNRGSVISMETSNTDIETIRLVAQENGDLGQGGELRLGTENGDTTIEIDGDVSNAGEMRLRNASGQTTIHLQGGATGGGRITTEVIEITGGADLSETFDVRDTGTGGAGDAIEPGMVVSIDPTTPGALALAAEPYDRRVAGVISGAGGVKPGMLMGQNGTVAQGAHPVALTGRVYVWADASTGAIAPGDLLTTSATPGHAMAVADHDRAGGAILGKAMTGLDEGRGLVLVLVALQ